ncbi:MAG: ABC transporter permease subunit [Myxococcota bacterium]|nr:ABC transporter permease subunit [Myxococcota bacterium]
MRNIQAIASRELAFLFNSPIAYIAITVFLAICGVYLFVIYDFFQANQAEMRPLFEQIPLFFILYVPAITMRLISEEKRSGTIELLATWPVSDTQIVLGKFLGALGFLLVTLGMSLVFPLLVGYLGPIDSGAVIGGYLGLVLVGAAYLSMGLLTSSWTENQIVAFILAVLLCSFFYSVDGLVGSFWEAGRDAFAFLSFKAHFSNITRGVIDTRDIIFYLSVIALALLLTVQSLQARRWR